MFNKLLLIFKKSIWLYPAMISLISFFGALFVVYLDSGIYINLTEFLPSILFTSVDLSKTILTVIAGALITMTTFTFSTTMVVLTTYSSQFSPRTVENFLSDETTMKTLGIFTGGFVYSITALLFMRITLGEQLVVSATLAIIYSLVCLAYFILYITHVGSFIQTNNLIERLYVSALKRIEEYKDLIEDKDIVEREIKETEDLIIRITSRDNGYIQLIDHGKISEIASEINCLLVFEERIGSFVSDSTVIFTLHLNENTEYKQDYTEKLLETLTIGMGKSEIQDFSFAIQKIVEIALRAISPGVNDPNTANHCLKIIGILLGKIAELKDGYIIFKENDNKEGKAIFRTISFEKEIYYTLYQIVHYGKSDISVMLSMLQGLLFSIEKSRIENQKAIVSFVDYTWNKLDSGLKEGYDNILLEKARNKIIAHVQNS
jgi:uncharacterized membrane protein